VININNLITPLPLTREQAIKQAQALHRFDLQWHLDDEPSDIIDNSNQVAFAESSWPTMRAWTEAVDGLFRDSVEGTAINRGAWRCAELAGWFGEVSEEAAS
jgi:hypothetical protein